MARKKDIQPNPELLKKAKEKGYFIRCYYILMNVTIGILRILEI